jgi:hypothetical protein
MKSVIVSIALCFLCVEAQAQHPKRRIKPPVRRVQHYDPKSEAMRLLFGPMGLPALTRPADPWNRRRYVTPYNRYRRPYGY